MKRKSMINIIVTSLRGIACFSCVNKQNQVFINHQSPLTIKRQMYHVTDKEKPKTPVYI